MTDFSILILDTCFVLVLERVHFQCLFIYLFTNNALHFLFLMIADGFRWSDKAEVNFFNWAPGEPSSKIRTSSSSATSFTNDSVRYEEGCVRMDPNTAKWSDADCLSNSPAYICKEKKSK